MTLAGKTVFVTGATGFLGGVLARRLATEGADVRALARNPDRAKHIRDTAGITIVEGDITDAARMTELIQGAEYVFHVAAALGGSIESQRRVNVDGTRNVLEAAANAGVRRVVHISTISVYGYQNKTDVTENTPPNPKYEGYGITKLEGENVAREISAASNLDLVVIRPGMIYGPRSGLWTGQMFKLAKRRPTIFIGDGSGSSYPIYVDDVVEMCVICAEHPSAANETFHCTPDPSPTWRAFLGAYSHLAGHSRWLAIPPVLLKPIAFLAGKFAPKHSRAREFQYLLPFSQRYITYKMTKAENVLGWMPRVSLVEGVRRCEPWLREKGLL